MNTINEYRNNCLMEPLFLFNDKFCAVFTEDLPDGFSAASWDVAKRAGTVAIALFAYISLSFAALIGFVFDPLIREGNDSDLYPTKPDQMQTIQEPGANPPVESDQKNNNDIRIHITVEELKKTSRLFKGYDLWMNSAEIGIITSKKYFFENNNENVLNLPCLADDSKVDWEPTLGIPNPYLHFLKEKPNARYILIPIHFSSYSHFSGIVVDRGEDRKGLKFIIYNGYSNSRSDIEDFFVNKISEQAGIPAERIQNKTLHQKDAWSCGYRTLKFFDDIVSGKTLEEIDKEELKIEEFHSYVNDHLEYLKTHLTK